jgi:hypothetical protein
MNRLYRHIRSALAVQSACTPWPWMFIVAITTLLPLLAGIVANRSQYGILGGLMGYCLSISTESGPLPHRLKVAVVAFCTFAGAFLLGVLLRPFSLSIYALSVAGPYAIGLMAGRGRELERLLILGGVHLYVAWYAPVFVPAVLSEFLVYPALAFAAVLASNSVASTIWPFAREPSARIRDMVAVLRPGDRTRHFYALTYVTAILLSLALAEHFAIERGYWTVITTLLIMKPTREESLQRVTQRIFGTLLGVAVGRLLVVVALPSWTLALVAAGFATLVPYVWSRNYWLVAFSATAFVISLLDLAARGLLSPEITMLRLKATLYGCGVSLVTILFFQACRSRRSRTRERSTGSIS